MSAQPEHRHNFQPAVVRHRDGTHIPGGRRCSCGMEVVGEAPFGINANLVRAGRAFNRAYGDAAIALAKAITGASRKTR